MCLVNKQTIIGVKKINNGFILWHNVVKNVFYTNKQGFNPILFIFYANRCLKKQQKIPQTSIGQGFNPILRINNNFILWHNVAKNVFYVNKQGFNPILFIFYANRCLTKWQKIPQTSIGQGFNPILRINNGLFYGIMRQKMFFMSTNRVLALFYLFFMPTLV